MSRYYAKGSLFANDFIGESKKHFGEEWRKTKAESAALSYILNVLMSDETLFGGHVHWIAHRLRGADEVVAVDRKATFRAFRRGELAYRDTPVGGCTKVGACDETPLNWLNAKCLGENCRNLVGSAAKLNRAIVAQERLVETLEEGTVQYRSEKADLDALVSARERFLEA